MKIIWIFAAVLLTHCVQKKSSTDSNGGSAVPLPLQAIITSSNLAPQGTMERMDQNGLTQQINRETAFNNPTKQTTNSSSKCAALDSLVISSAKSYLKIEGTVDVTSCMNNSGTPFTGTANYRIATGISCSTGKDFTSYNGKKVGDFGQTLVLDCPAGSIQKYLNNTIMTINGSFTSQGQTIPVRSVNYTADMTAGGQPCEREYKTDQIVVRDCIYTDTTAGDATSSTPSTYTQITFQNVAGRLKANLFDSGSVPFVIGDWRGTMTYSNQSGSWKAVDKNSAQASGTYTPTTNLVGDSTRFELPWKL